MKYPATEKYDIVAGRNIKIPVTDGKILPAE
jgi:hypothetical protein